MTSTLPPDPPNFNGINYNGSFWSNATSTGLTYNQALKNFLAFPIAQGTETLQNTNVNGTLTLINPLTPSETYSQYIDNDPSLDMTLSTAQTSGGLTIRTPTNSFTMNPKTFNINLTTPTPVTGLQMLNPINMANFNIGKMGQYSTAYTQALNTHEDYVATCNYVNDMIVNGGGILDNANDWTNTNTFQSYLNVGTVNTSNYYSQISQLANGALNINNQCPTANFPNTNFKCNNGSNVMTTYFSITPQELDTFTTLNMNSQNIINCNQITDTTGQYVITNTPPDTDNGQSIATTAYVTTKVNNAVQVVRTGLTYTIPSSNVSSTPQPVDNTISNTQSTIFLSLNFIPTVTSVGPFGINFNNNIYNGTFSSYMLMEYSAINLTTAQQQGIQLSITTPTQITIKNLSIFTSGVTYFITISLVISST